MSNVRNSEGVLVRIDCDGYGCDASIKPNPQIVHSGWMEEGHDCGPGTPKHRSTYCPKCWYEKQKTATR